MSISKLVALFAGAVVLALVAIGCGSSDDDTGSTEAEASITKAEFIKEANGICAAGNKEIESAIEEEGEPKSEAEGEAFIEDTVIPAISQQLDEISALGFPDDEAEEIVESAEEDLEEAEEDPKALGETKSFAETSKMARAYGLDVCGEE